MDETTSNAYYQIIPNCSWIENTLWRALLAFKAGTGTIKSGRDLRQPTLTML